MSATKPVRACEIAAQVKKSSYPEPFSTMMEGRTKRKLGDYFGLQNFGVNLTELAPGAMSALKHRHSRQDEWIYVLSGNLTLLSGNESYPMEPGQCMGFPAAAGAAHQLVNQSDQPARYLEIGDRVAGDVVEYPDDDLAASSQSGGGWQFTHKDGTPY
jgi:uncharacterized cupin superfamily protein